MFDLLDWTVRSAKGKVLLIKNKKIKIADIYIFSDLFIDLYYKVLAPAEGFGVWSRLFLQLG